MSFTTDSAIFLDDPEGFEVARILGDTARRVRSGEREGRVRDANGNDIGAWKFTKND